MGEGYPGMQGRESTSVELDKVGKEGKRGSLNA